MKLKNSTMAENFIFNLLAEPTSSSAICLCGCNVHGVHGDSTIMSVQAHVSIYIVGISHPKTTFYCSIDKDCI